MQRFAAVVACVFVGCLSPTLRAQSPAPAPAPAPPITQHAFTYCSVIDTAGHKVWASPVFEYEYLPDGKNQFSRTQDMATEFHTFVGSMGGAGDKSCQLANGGQVELEAFRDESRAILTKRFMGVVRAHKWMDVTWTPKPWSPAAEATKPAAVTKYFYCVATDADLRKTVAALVFEMSVDTSDPVAPYTQSEAYGKQFTREVAAPNGLAQAYPSCHYKDTRAEAEKALHDYRKLFSGFNLKFTDVTWHPTPEAAAMPPTAAAPAPTTTAASPAPARGTLGVEVGEVSPTLALALGMDRARGALVVNVLKGSPAEAAGIKPLDVVLSVNQQTVNVFADLTAIISRLPAGAPVALQLWRERGEHEVRLALSGSPAVVATATAPSIAPLADTAAAPAAKPGKYCLAYMSFIGQNNGVRSKVWESHHDSEEAEVAMVVAFAAHMHQLQPKVWHEFISPPPPQCDRKFGFCYAAVGPATARPLQMVGQICRSIRAEVDAAWNLRADMETVDWPVGA